MNGRAAQKAEDIQLVALDVDGVLTDGSVLYGASDQDEIKSFNIKAFRVAYMGDDLPDLSAMNLAGLATCPNDAAAPVQAAADWIAPCAGGRGAVRALSDFLLTSQGLLAAQLSEFQ